MTTEIMIREVRRDAQGEVTAVIADVQAPHGWMKKQWLSAEFLTEMVGCGEYHVMNAADFAEASE